MPISFKVHETGKRGSLATAYSGDSLRGWTNGNYTEIRLTPTTSSIPNIGTDSVQIFRPGANPAHPEVYHADGNRGLKVTAQKASEATRFIVNHLSFASNATPRAIATKDSVFRAYTASGYSEQIVPETVGLLKTNYQYPNINWSDDGGRQYTKRIMDPRKPKVEKKEEPYFKQEPGTGGGRGNWPPPYSGGGSGYGRYPAGGGGYGGGSYGERSSGGRGYSGGSYGSGSR